jgi:uncharacterized protein (DUF58 family)
MAARMAIVVMLVLFAAGAATGFEVLSRLGYAVLGFLALAYAWARFSVHDLELTRTLSGTRFGVGEMLEERLTVHNPGWWPVFWVEIREPTDLPGHHPGRVLSLPPRGRHEWVVRTDCRRRGRYVIGPLELHTGDPFGMFPQSRYAGTVQHVIVYPPVTRLHEFHLWGGELAGGRALARWTQQITPSASGIRDYLPGDSFNRVHWPSTARLNRLMVKEFEPDPTSDVWLVLDLERRVQVGSDDDGTEEYGVKIAASLAMHFLDQERAVGFIAAAQRYEVIPPDRGQRQALRLLEELALLRAEGQVPLARVLQGEVLRFGPAAAVLIVTPSLDVQWIHAAHQLASRGLRVAVVLIEPGTFGAAATAFHAIGALASAAIPSFLVKRGDALERVLVARGERVLARRR